MMFGSIFCNQGLLANVAEFHVLKRSILRFSKIAVILGFPFPSLTPYKRFEHTRARMDSIISLPLQLLARKAA